MSGTEYKKWVTVAAGCIVAVVAVAMTVHLWEACDKQVPSGAVASGNQPEPYQLRNEMTVELSERIRQGNEVLADLSGRMMRGDACSVSAYQLDQRSTADLSPSDSAVVTGAIRQLVLSEGLCAAPEKPTDFGGVNAMMLALEFSDGRSFYIGSGGDDLWVDGFRFFGVPQGDCEKIEQVWEKYLLNT